MISDLDKNKSGSIDFEEFLDMMTARMSDKDTREDISKVFRLFDDDTSGSITLRNLRRVAKELGEGAKTEDILKCMEAVGGVALKVALEEKSAGPFGFNKTKEGEGDADVPVQE